MVVQLSHSSNTNTYQCQHFNCVKYFVENRNKILILASSYYYCKLCGGNKNLPSTSEFDLRSASVSASNPAHYPNKGQSNASMDVALFVLSKSLKLRRCSMQRHKKIFSTKQGEEWNLKL